MKEKPWYERLEQYLPDGKIRSEKEQFISPGKEDFSRKQSRRHLVSMPAQKVLDLHGLIQADAKTELDYFIKTCLKLGVRKALIIHGKGLHSKGKPILKTFVMEYLSRHPDILEYDQAGIRQGGAGATWIILRGYRSR